MYIYSSVGYFSFTIFKLLNHRNRVAVRTCESIIVQDAPACAMPACVVTISCETSDVHTLSDDLMCDERRRPRAFLQSHVRPVMWTPPLAASSHWPVRAAAEKKAKKSEF